MKSISFALLLAMSLPVFADRMPFPTDTPTSYREECGSCHMAFQPGLLAAPDWQRTMRQLPQHFGTDATVDHKKWQEISHFLESHAGKADKLGAAGEPPRITRTARFVRKHHEIAPALWKDARVKSAANCEACHRGAVDGRYSEHDIVIPELRR